MLKHEFENVNVFPSFHIISYQRLYLPFKGGFKGSFKGGFKGSFKGGFKGSFKGGFKGSLGGFSRVSEGVKKLSINSQK